MVKNLYIILYVISLFLVCDLGAKTWRPIDDEIQTPDYYEVKVRNYFKTGAWESGKRLLDVALKHYEELSGLNELMGRYYYQHKKNYDLARFYLVRSVRDNPENVTAKQMLVNVEEESGHYSSAICYVNELLEINPYWQGLWRKKIGLYRKQGNDVEADRLLKRLYQIYPNDSVVRRDYAYSLEEKYLHQRKAGEYTQAIASLNTLIDVDPDNEQYYLALANQYLQHGDTDNALTVLGKGLSYLPNSVALITKKAGILAENSRREEAMDFVQMQARRIRNPRLYGFYNTLLSASADAAKLNDPYVLHAKLYERSKSSTSLDYLVGASIMRGYNEDALYYLSEAKKKRGELPNLLYKEYTVYKRMGNMGKANAILATLVDMNPSDTALVDEYALNRLHQAGQLINDGLPSQALPHLDYVVRNCYDKEVKTAAFNKLYGCYYDLKRYDKAMVVLDSLHVDYYDDVTYFLKKADILNRRNDGAEAMALLDSIISHTPDFDDRAMYIISYEELAVPYIKQQIELGASVRAYKESVRLLEFNPSSMEGLLYAIGLSDFLGRYDDYDYYVGRARSFYPDEVNFVVKEAVSYSRKGDYPKSIVLLNGWLEEYPGNKGLVGAFSENSELLTYRLIKAHKPDSAMTVVNRALQFDRKNRSLLFAKGSVYEALKQYDSAHYYQRHYLPGPIETAGFKRHLKGLKSRTMKHELAAEYLQGRYGDEDILMAVATLGYSYHSKRNTYTARVNYAGRDGYTVLEDKSEDQVTGGQGIQLQAEWEHQFLSRWSGAISAAWSTKYFPVIMVNLKAGYELDNEVMLDAHASYRRISTYSKEYEWSEAEPPGWVFVRWNEEKHNLFSFGVGASKTWDRMILGGKVDGFLLAAGLYLNASAQFKYFPLEDGRTSITLLGALGSAPEANMIDYAMPGTFDKLNSMVGLGGMYMINEHLSLGLMGTWHTFYSQLNQRDGLLAAKEAIETKYRNLFNVHVQLHIYF